MTSEDDLMREVRLRAAVAPLRELRMTVMVVEESMMLNLNVVCIDDDVVVVEQSNSECRGTHTFSSRCMMSVERRIDDTQQHHT